MLKHIKCPYCGHEFSVNVQANVNRSRSVTMRFMGVSRSMGRSRTAVEVTCKNEKCRKKFDVDT